MKKGEWKRFARELGNRLDATNRRFAESLDAARDCRGRVEHLEMQLADTVSASVAKSAMHELDEVKRLLEQHRNRIQVLDQQASQHKGELRAVMIDCDNAIKARDSATQRISQQLELNRTDRELAIQITDFLAAFPEINEKFNAYATESANT